MVTKVLVITAIDPESRSDLQIVMVARVRGVPRVSAVVTLEGATSSRKGNPYLVYGDAVSEFTGLDDLDTSITVADCRSGDLSDWE